MLTPRELRLRYEFEQMKALRSPHRLFDFNCADLEAPLAQELLYKETSFDVIMRGLRGFLPPEEYEARYPGIPPEKYLIGYNCKGLGRTEQGEIVGVEVHMMEVVFGWRYPAEPPKFIWLTPIWHPNFRQPYVCIEGHPFAIGLTLDQIIPEVGRMVQYQNYNVKSPLNSEAAEWARQNPNRFPIDHRDIMDKRRRFGDGPSEPLIVLPGQTEAQENDQLIELT
jgi:hypothetical protein